MSTKIYEAYDVTPLKTMEKVFDLVMELKKMCFKEHCHMVKCMDWNRYVKFEKEKVGATLTSRIQNSIKECDLEKPIASWLIRDILRHEIEKGINDPTNIMSSVVVIPHKKKMILIPFGLSKEINKHLDKKFKQYGYWNNTDRPDDVSNKEWKAREKFYDGLDSRGHTFAHFGFSYDLHDVWAVVQDLERYRKTLTEKK
jgi:hypothetical protein